LETGVTLSASSQLAIPAWQGPLRAAINFGNPVLAQRSPDGEPMGVSVALAKALARELGVPLDMVFYEAAGHVTASVHEGKWDIAFCALDPVRAQELDFTAPYVLIEGTYLVWKEAPFQTVQDIDQADVEVSVGKGAAYDLFLTRELKNAELVRVSTSAAAVEAFLDKQSTVAAGVRQPLERVAAARQDLRVLPGSFTSIQQAMAKPKTGKLPIDYLKDFVERQKNNGMVQAGLDASGQAAASVAPLVAAGGRSVL